MDERQIPTPLVVAMCGLALIILSDTARFGVFASTPQAVGNPGAMPGLVLIWLVIISPAALALVLVARGTKWAPVIELLVAIWVGSEIFTYADWLAWVSAAVALTTVVSVGLPQSREYASAETARRSSQRRS